MSYFVHCIELDGPRCGRNGRMSEVCGGFSLGPFPTFEEAKLELNGLRNRNSNVDGVVVENGTFNHLTYLHGSYVF